MFNDAVSTDNSFINGNDSVTGNNYSLNEDNSNDNNDKRYRQKKGYCCGRFDIKWN